MHRTASINEYSTRYSVAIDSQNTTKPGEWRTQSTDNKQGSGGSLSDGMESIYTERETYLYNEIKQIYSAMLKSGVAREQARKILPLSTYTEAYWKIDLHNLFHFLKLRLDSHAQLEIREFAQAIAEIVKDWVPMAWEAFEDYHLDAVTFSKQEMLTLRSMLEDLHLKDLSQNERANLLSGIESKRERIEFWRKINA